MEILVFSLNGITSTETPTKVSDYVKMFVVSSKTSSVAKTT